MHRTLLFLAILCTVIAQFSVADSISAAQLKQILEARDLQIDNCRIDFKHERTVQRTHGWSSNIENYPSENINEPFHVTTETYTLNNQLVLRGPEVTLIKYLDEEYKVPPDQLKPGIRYFAHFTKTSNIGGYKRSLTEESPDASRSIKSLIIESCTPGCDSMQQVQSQVEFSLGIGFGKRIKNITSIKEEDDTIFAVGEIKFWKDDESTFKLLLDKDYIVRQATIKVATPRAKYLVHVTTTGTVEREGVYFAKSGTTIWDIVPEFSDELDSKDVQQWSEITVEFKDFRLGLTNQEYSELTDMSVPDGSWIRDLITGDGYFKGSPPFPTTSVKDTSAEKKEFGEVKK